MKKIILEYKNFVQKCRQLVRSMQQFVLEEHFEMDNFILLA